MDMHRPDLHHSGAKRRYVLPDWELDQEPARGGWIVLGDPGQLIRYGVDGRQL
jgi:UDP-2,3-diacylglucosamine hydrolase